MKPKKPTELERTNGTTKTKTLTTKVAVKPKENGVTETTTVISEITISSNGIESQLLKDNSPVENIIDNSQLPETQVAD